MATNINFTNDLNGESDANISYNLPRKIYRDSLKRAVAAGATAEAESCTYNIMLDMDYKRLLNRASLLVTPTLYKEGVLYPQIPTYNSNGDFSVTRATTATRVNAAGLVELVPYNLLTWSQDFSSNWTLVQSTTTSGQADPFGGNNAIKLKYNTSSSLHSIYQLISLTGNNAHSVYAKAGELQFLQIASAQNVEEYANFNLGTGVIGTYGSLASNVQIENIGDGWYRCSVVFTNGSNAIYCAIASSASMGWLGIDYFAGANTTDGLFLYGAQINEGSLKDYQATETRLNIPRIDYSNGSCPNILLEPQRTNVLQRSEEFNDAYWTKLGVGITANTTNSPSGILNADTLKEDASTGVHELFRTPFPITAGTHTLSIFVKNSVGSRFINLSVSGITTDYASVRFSPSTATLSSVVVSGSFTNGSATFQTLTNGWYRVSLTYSTTSNPVPQIALSTDGSNANVGAFGVQSYTGDNTSALFIWGAQLEAGAYETSYIPTTSASVTRNKDLGNNDVFASTYTLDADFCLFQDFECFDFNNFPVFWSGGNYSTGPDYRSYMLANSTTVLNLFGVNEVLTGQLTAFTFSANTRYKLAVRRVGSTISWFINGVKYLNAGGTTTTTIKIRSISGSSLGGQNVMRLNTAVIFEDATLTDGQCSMLTSGIYTPALAYAQLGLTSESPACLDSSVNALL